jgi:hypothetical protein
VRASGRICPVAAEVDMSVIVVATARPLPGLRDEAVRKFEAAIAAVHKLDRGCELHACTRQMTGWS